VAKLKSLAISVTINAPYHGTNIDAIIVPLAGLKACCGCQRSDHRRSPRDGYKARVFHIHIGFHIGVLTRRLR
jgi:hypothetical protein